MLGGYQILDLTNLSLSASDDYVTISDKNILKQLSDYLIGSINENYYQEKQKTKPVIIRLLDSDDEFINTVWGNVIQEYIETFTIYAKVDDGKEIRISIEFTKETDDDGNTYYVIDTASYKYNQIKTGTKLYKHKINLVGETQDQEECELELVLISNNSKPIDVTTKNKNLRDDFICQNYFQDLGSDLCGYIIDLTIDNSGNWSVKVVGADNTDIENYLGKEYSNITFDEQSGQGITDTVTPL